MPTDAWSRREPLEMVTSHCRPATHFHLPPSPPSVAACLHGQVAPPTELLSRSIVFLYQLSFCRAQRYLSGGIRIGHFVEERCASRRLTSPGLCHIPIRPPAVAPVGASVSLLTLGTRRRTHNRGALLSPPHAESITYTDTHPERSNRNRCLLPKLVGGYSPIP